MLTHFKLAGVFNTIAGMVIWELALYVATDSSLSKEDVVLALTSEYEFPILSGVKFGHTKEKLTVPDWAFGITWHLWIASSRELNSSKDEYVSQK